MSKLLTMRYSHDIEGDKNSCSCEACGHFYENPISLTNLSTMQMETYKACPFCFTKQNKDEMPAQILRESTSSDIIDKSEKLENPPSVDNDLQIDCAHHFGYLKKRPKDTPIPEACLTCKKMIQCLI